jgi:hypothetical protein
MWNKFLVTTFAGVVLTLSAPIAQAADIPVLTWEKGKEHNIILGGNGQVKDWNISLQGVNKKSSLNFTMSSMDVRGFVVFSVNIPETYPNGVYDVVTNSTAEGSKVVAGVRITNITNYNLLQIPTKLIIILLTLIFLMSTLSILRMEKYERIEYIRSKLGPEPKGLFGVLYRARNSMIEEIHKSILKFKIIREGELLHKFSPSAWAVLPWIALMAGGLISISGRLASGAQLIPVIVYAAIAVLGLLDPFSGFMAAIGFGVVHSITGNVTSVRSVMSLIAVGVGWVAPGLVASLYQDALNKDKFNIQFKNFLPDLIASVMGGLVFFTAQLLTNSFADHQEPVESSGYIVPIFFSIFIFVRIKIEKYLNKDLHQKGENYQMRVMVLPRVVSPRTIAFAALYFGCATFAWTQSLWFSVEIGLFLAFPLALLMVRFENPVIPIFKNITRNIFYELISLGVIACSVFNYIQSLPLDVMGKGRTFIVYSAALIAIHAIYSSIVDSSSRKVEIAVAA